MREGYFISKFWDECDLVKERAGGNGSVRRREGGKNEEEVEEEEEKKMKPQKSTKIANKLSRLK